ncbi:MAG TPA: hypothetical protein VIJ57_03605, partial [Hanamia sp.]
MNKRIILASVGVVLVFLLFFFGKTTTVKKEMPGMPANASAPFNLEDSLKAARQSLSPQQLLFVTNLENNVKRGDLKNQSENQYTNLANFWKDSAGKFLPYAWYLSEGAKLDNSEKKLTFA